MRVALAVAAFALVTSAVYAQERTSSPAGAEVYIISPKDGASVKSPVKVVFGLKGMGVAPAGIKMENYIAWMKSAYWISTVGNPAMSVPCAFSSTGLPIGVQIVGRHHDDWGVLQMGYAFEQVTRLTEKRPPIAL